MTTHDFTPELEAIVLKRPARTTGELTVSLDFDPIMIPVENGRVADVFNRRLMDLMDALVEGGDDRFDYQLAWSDTREPVMGTCPVCDDGFIVSDGANGDTWNEGYDAVWCGCDPKDSSLDD